MRKKGDLLKIKSFEAIEINKIPVDPRFPDDTPSLRCSVKLKNGSKFWIVIPEELITERTSR